MGSSQSEVHHEDPMLSVILDSRTPVVGIEMTPIIHLRHTGACIFEWHRLQTPTNTPELTCHHISVATDVQIEQDEYSSCSDSDDEPEKEAPDRISLSDMKPIQLQRQPSNPLLRKALNSPTTNDPSSTINTEDNSNMIPVLVSQAASYTPTRDDIGRKLRLRVVFVGNKQQGNHNLLITMEETLLFPSRVPTRGWLKNKIYIGAKHHLQAKKQEGHIASSLDSSCKKNSKIKLHTQDVLGDLVEQSLREHKGPEILFNCPDYVLTDKYRRKLIMLGLTAHTPDILCLQRVHYKEYNKWYSELSMKSGMSAVYYRNVVVSDTSKNASPIKKEDDGDITDHGDSSCYGNVTLYRRSRFSLMKEWSIRTSEVQGDEDPTLLAVITEFEFKDMFDMMNYMNKMYNNVGVEHSFKNIRLVVVNLFLSQDENKRLAQIRYITSKVQRSLSEIDLKSTETRSCVVYCGNFNSTVDDNVYKYMTGSRGPQEQRLDLAAHFKVPNKHDSSSVFEPVNDSEKFAPKETTSDGLCHQSANGVILKKEPQYMVNDTKHSVCSTKNFVFYNFHDVQVRRVVRQVREALPNHYHASQESSLVVEFEFSLIG
ncbi:hypothetical protein AKO1_010679 [Acrasis kona]|uniref:Endonuclease/exonuclease/phosphatase domain-containing protein n=1 Tax=Acrasis kona TaxID=1008807 RepID=A0AAW2ZJC2_9EUKA